MPSSELAGALFERFSSGRRAARAALFRDQLAPTDEDRILDLGSEEGGHIAAVVPFRRNVTIADIDPAALERGHERYGFQTVTLGESDRLPFPDHHFDIVFCSSVIEHVTVPKDQLRAIRNGRAFAEAAWARQCQFADEIRRISRGYFVQTPNKWYPVESHTWLPLPIVLLPRGLQLDVVAQTNRWWVKQTEVDWNLLTGATMRELFPDAELVRERTFGLTKSLIAVKCPAGERAAAAATSAPV